MNNVKFQDFKSKGIPYININLKGKCSIGGRFHMINSLESNPIGRSHKCCIRVQKNAELVIENNVGISFTSINCSKYIKIGSNVKIGGGTVIYDSDFHSLNHSDRLDNKLDEKNTTKMDVIIYDNVFIGTNSTILKGVSIGENSIVAACSVVTKSIPANEIWGGNPAKFIKKYPYA